MVRHDFECPDCHTLFRDLLWNCQEQLVCKCGGKLQIHWCRPRGIASAHPSERTVVWENPSTGDVKYPGRNDTPIPKRYELQGYVRRELDSLRKIESFEREKGVRSEVAWFDKGSGRSFDDEG